MELPGWGSDPSCSCDLSRSCSNPGSFNSLCQAGNWTLVPAHPRCRRSHCATAGPPGLWKYWWRKRLVLLWLTWNLLWCGDKSELGHRSRCYWYLAPVRTRTTSEFTSSCGGQPAGFLPQGTLCFSAWDSLQGHQSLLHLPAGQPTSVRVNALGQPSASMGQELRSQYPSFPILDGIIL